MKADVSPVIWTVGHSSRSLDSFLGLLTDNRIGLVADVRRYPGSRSFPHFNPRALENALDAGAIRYLHFPELGGRRAPDPASANTVWKNAAFRAYADYMERPEFHAGLARLLQSAQVRRTVILCAEALWWRCHRSMIADALKSSGVTVLHIWDPGKTSEHPYTAAARIVDGRLHYGPAPDAAQRRP